MDHRVSDLREMVNQLQNPLEEDFVMKIMYDLLLAVSYCHESGVVHRDIKMENILIDYDESSQNIIVELIDFGLAAYSSDKRAMRETVGTEIIMAPEVIMKARCSAKADCWSLGIVMFELVAGTLPFYSPDAKQLKQMICSFEI